MAITTPHQAPGNSPTLSFGIGYGNDPQCDDINGEDGGYGAMQPAVSPNMQHAQWGPVEVEFVVHDVYTPAHPSGNESVVAVNIPVLSAFQKGTGEMYSIASTQGSFTRGVLLGGTSQMVGLKLSSLYGK